MDITNQQITPTQNIPQDSVTNPPVSNQKGIMLLILGVAILLIIVYHYSMLITITRYLNDIHLARGNRQSAVVRCKFFLFLPRLVCFSLLLFFLLSPQHS